MKVYFDDWTIHLHDVEFFQYDNKSRVIDLDGELPPEYTWELLVQTGNNADILNFEPFEGEKQRVVLTSDNLSVAGIYYFQLRGKLISDGVTTRHTNIVTALISNSLTGVGTWPEVPKVFTDIAEQVKQDANRAEEAGKHAPIIRDDYWWTWDVTKGEYVNTGVPATSGGPGGGTTDHSKLTLESRSLAEQHPIKAISGLQEALNGKQPTGNYATKDEIPSVPDVPEWAMQPQKPTYTADEVGALAETELQTGVDSALAKAKESGEFNGEPGKTPVKGVDYFTQAEVQDVAKEAAKLVEPGSSQTAVLYTPQELTEEQKAQARGNIGVTGSGGTGLTDTEKQLMMALFKATPYTSDMSSTIKNLETIWGGGTGKKYTIAYHLTDVTAEPNPGEVADGAGLTINLRAVGAKDITTVIVLMGGRDITKTAYKNRQIVIPSVMGDVDITASASAAEYKAVEYLEVVNPDSYLLTDRIMQATDTIKLSVSFDPAEGQININDFIFGACSNTVSYSIARRFVGTETVIYSRRSGKYNTDLNPSVISNVVVPNKKYTFDEVNPGNVTVYDDMGAVVATVTDDETPSISTPYGQPSIFRTERRAGAVAPFKAIPGDRFYGLQIKDNTGTVIAEYVPALDLAEKPCMYDKVSKKHYYDKNTVDGGIIAGPEV